MALVSLFLCKFVWQVPTRLSHRAFCLHGRGRSGCHGGQRHLWQKFALAGETERPFENNNTLVHMGFSQLFLTRGESKT
ncbi:hypothetical protein DFJ77DRAFT_161066 [Powellomyces hirtus]|nr:hypothetical protein DFJ77DRAFT_161066 [Powellomyces hirtus]